MVNNFGYNKFTDLVRCAMALFSYLVMISDSRKMIRPFMYVHNHTMIHNFTQSDRTLRTLNKKEKQDDLKQVKLHLHFEYVFLINAKLIQTFSIFFSKSEIALFCICLVFPLFFFLNCFNWKFSKAKKTA